jgi:hypothetical protein
VGSIAHLFPFQASASPRLACVPLPACSTESPTAVHAVADVQDTATRSLLRAPVGLGVGSIAHVFPFQASASVPPRPPPTAVHAVAEVHDTEERDAPFGVAVGSIVHVFPFQASASVRLVSALLV